MVAARPPATTAHALPSGKPVIGLLVTNARSPRPQASSTLSTLGRSPLAPIRSRHCSSPATVLAARLRSSPQSARRAILRSTRGRQGSMSLAVRAPEVTPSSTATRRCLATPLSASCTAPTSWRPFRRPACSAMSADRSSATRGGCSHRKRRCRITTNDKPEMAELVEAALKADVRDIIETGAKPVDWHTPRCANGPRPVAHLPRSRARQLFPRAVGHDRLKARLITSASRARST